MRVAVLGRNAVCTLAFGGFVLVAGAACADENAADAIAEKFSRAAEGLVRREAEAKRAKIERANMAGRKLKARRKAEAERRAYERRKAETAAALQAEEQRQAETARRGAEAEEKFKRVFERGRSAWLNAQ